MACTYLIASQRQPLRSGTTRAVLAPWAPIWRPIVTAPCDDPAPARAQMNETPRDEAGEPGNEGLRIRGIAQRESVPVPSHDGAVPWYLCPPLRASDGDAAWGLGIESTEDVDQALKDKLARFYELKAQGTHFNAALTRNRAFHNPHIHAKLVEWASLDEYGSNYSAIAAAKGVTPSWDAANTEVLRHGTASVLGTILILTPAAEQKQYAESRAAHARTQSRTHIPFAHASRIQQND